MALPLVALGFLASASGGSKRRIAIVRAAVAPIDAILERNPAKLCNDFVPIVAEKLVRAAGAGETCETAAANVFRSAASTDSRAVVVAYFQPLGERLVVSGSHASITVRGSYEVADTRTSPRSVVRVAILAPLRIQLEEQSGVWRVSSRATLAAFCPRTECAEGSSELLFSYGEPRSMPLRLVSVPPAVRHAGGAEKRVFDEGMRVTAQSGCLACHRIGVVGNRGPGQDLTHVGADLTEPEIARALADPRKPMPSFGKLPRAKFRAVVRFLSLLR